MGFVKNITINFGLTVVSNSATQIGTTTNWAVVKGTNGYVYVQATLSDTNLIPLLTWTGGEAVTNNPLQRQVTMTNSAETTVTASIGGTNLSLNVWVIWATSQVFGRCELDTTHQPVWRIWPASILVYYHTRRLLAGYKSILRQ